MDPYKILGVEKCSSQEEILKAYRCLALKYHPDKNPEHPHEAAEKFKEVCAAFELIGEEKRRKKYDIFGESPATSFSFRNRNSVDDIFDNMFSQVFGNQKNSKIRIKITLEEAYFGCVRKINSEKQKACDLCKGTGSVTWDPCSKCDGKGFIFTNNGSLRVQASCSNCSGRGSISIEKCKECSSKGYIVEGTKEVEVSIPEGIEDGTQIRFAEEAADGGDLFVVVQIDKNKKIIREGKNLFGNIDVPYSTLILGGTVQYDLFGFKIDIKIPPRLNAGSRLRIKNKGMPVTLNPAIKGDLFIDIKLRIPVSLTKEHEDLLSQLSKIENI